MATFSPPGLLIWVAMPNGAIRASASTQLKLSVMLSPRLASRSTNATVDGGEFPHFDDWPARAAGLAFNVEIDATPKTVSSATSDTRPLSSATWKALFSGLRVDSHVPVAPGLAADAPTTYSVRVNYGNLADGYGPAPGPHPTAPLSAAASRQRARVELARRLGTTADEEQRLRERLAQLKQQFGSVSAARIAEVADVTADALHFAELSSFYDGLTTGVKNRVREAPADPPSFDFHQAITAVARYPALMRKLGLVLDLTLPLDNASIAALPAEGRVRAVVSQDVEGWRSYSPWTTYTLDGADGFYTAPASDSLGVAAGMLMPVDTDTAMVLDIDAVAPKIRTAVRAFAMKGSEAQDITLPAPRSGGLALARDGLAQTLQQMLQRQVMLEGGLPAAVEGLGDVTLATEDLLRGFRVDIRRDGDGRWLSLNQRNGSYSLRNGASFSDLVDEGFISLQVFNPDSDASPVPFAHESLFRWTGWSLSVPRPGRPWARTADPSLVTRRPPVTCRSASISSPSRIRSRDCVSGRAMIAA